jgi:hypothetical protein
MCAVLNLHIFSVYTIHLGNDNFEAYTNVGIPPDGVSSWTSAVATLFHDAPTEYAVATDSVIQFLLHTEERQGRRR